MPLELWKIDILKNAIKKWGIDSQLDMLIEECAELIVALQHFKRRRINWEDVAEEIADVKIMCAQMETFENITSLVSKIEMEKLKRLEERLK